MDELDKVTHDLRLRVRLDKSDILSIEDGLMAVRPRSVGPHTAVCEYNGEKWWLEATYLDRIMFRKEVGMKKGVRPKMDYD
jgi:hypothetical protein